MVKNNIEVISLIFKSVDYLNLIYDEFKKCIDDNILKDFDFSENQDYKYSNLLTYKHRNFNEDESALFPKTNPSAPNKIDFPAPVSPVITVIPRLKSIFNSSTTTRFLIFRYSSILLVI